jgi:hypothetical protein
VLVARDRKVSFESLRRGEGKKGMKLMFGSEQILALAMVLRLLRASTLVKPISLPKLKGL